MAKKDSCLITPAAPVLVLRICDAKGAVLEANVAYQLDNESRFVRKEVASV